MDDLMELSDKKKLAEVAGWKLDDMAYLTIEADYGRNCYFDPLGDHYWDILVAMTPEQRHTIQSELNLFDDCCFNDALWMNKNREAVINALLEVI